MEIDTTKLHAIEEGLSLLLEMSSVVELRVPNVNGKTFSGYFDNHTLLAEAASDLSGRAPGVYVTLNPVRPDLLARAVNRVIGFAKNTTRDADILLRRWLGIDFDPVRPAGVSSTDAEHNAALGRSRECADWLHAQGWPDSVLADSGNGGHLLYRLELPNEPANTELVKLCLQALGLRFSDEQVTVDLGTYNAARIWKLYGTLAAKGDNTPDRPHRHAKLLEVPSLMDVVSPVLLTQLAAMLPQAPKAPHKKGGFDLAGWLSQHEILIASEGSWNGGRKWILNLCPWNPEHTNKSAYIIQFPNGAIAAGCLHASCGDKNWPALRALFDSDAMATTGGCDSHRENGGGREPEKSTQVKHLLALGACAEFFHTPDGEPYASVPVNEHRENWPLKSKRFRQWLLGRYYGETQSAPKSQATQEAIGIFESKANFGGPEYPVFVRIAEKAGSIYLDLCNDRWEAVEIGASGWRLISDVPVRFRRTRGMCALPYPVRGGNISALRRFVNVGSDEDWMQLVAWQVAAFRPRGPYPILVLLGEQGSAKSTASRVLRALLDPNTAPLRAESRDLRDLVIAASNAWIISFDNLSRIPPWWSDALCRLATGGGFSTRELYTDSEEVLFDSQRPVILNAIEELASRGDLLDRALILYLPSIPEERREPESKFWSEFELARPELLGAFFDVVSAALRTLPNIKLSRKPRMADFAIWIAAAEAKLGWPDGAFLDAYAQNQCAANDLALEASPVSAPVQALARNGRFKGTATELLQALTSYADESVRSQESWPANGQVLSNTLRRLAPNLRKRGVNISFSRDPNRKRSRLITITNLASVASNASETPDSSVADWTQMDTGNVSLDASGSCPVLEKASATEDLNGTLDAADAADAKIYQSLRVQVAAGIEVQSPGVGQDRKRRVQGEL